MTNPEGNSDNETIESGGFPFDSLTKVGEFNPDAANAAIAAETEHRGVSKDPMKPAPGSEVQDRIRSFASKELQESRDRLARLSADRDALVADSGSYRRPKAKRTYTTKMGKIEGEIDRVSGRIGRIEGMMEHYGIQEEQPNGGTLEKDDSLIHNEDSVDDTNNAGGIEILSDDNDFTGTLDTGAENTSGGMPSESGDILRQPNTVAQSNPENADKSVGEDGEATVRSVESYTAEFESMPIDQQITIYMRTLAELSEDFVTNGVLYAEDVAMVQQLVKRGKNDGAIGGSREDTRKMGVADELVSAYQKKKRLDDRIRSNCDQIAKAYNVDSIVDLIDSRSDKNVREFFPEQGDDPDEEKYLGDETILSQLLLRLEREDENTPELAAIIKQTGDDARTRARITRVIGTRLGAAYSPRASEYSYSGDPTPSEINEYAGHIEDGGKHEDLLNRAVALYGLIYTFDEDGDEIGTRSASLSNESIEHIIRKEDHVDSEEDPSADNINQYSRGGDELQNQQENRPITDEPMDNNKK